MTGSKCLMPRNRSEFACFSLSEAQVRPAGRRNVGDLNLRAQRTAFSEKARHQLFKNQEQYISPIHRFTEATCNCLTIRLVKRTGPNAFSRTSAASDLSLLAILLLHHLLLLYLHNTHHHLFRLLDTEQLATAYSRL